MSFTSRPPRRSAKFQKALGQHFLKDPSVCENLLERASEIQTRHPVSSVLEIGPGGGALTVPLLDWCERQGLSYRAVERDRELATMLQLRLADRKRVTKVELADFLELPAEAWNSPAPFAVIANLPYSVGTAILGRLNENRANIGFMVLMFQAEVAQRIRAEPNTNHWGSLSLWIQTFWDVTKVQSVPPQAFSPPPKVNSEVIALEPRKTPRVGVTPDTEVLWNKLLRACFAHRRKMLRSGLSGDERAQKALVASGLDGTRRAEALGWQEWDLLFKAYCSVVESSSRP